MSLHVTRYQSVATQLWPYNQSLENAGVVCVKGANERNEFFVKINKQLCMMNKVGRTRQRTNNLREELVWE